MAVDRTRFSPIRGTPRARPDPPRHKQGTGTSASGYFPDDVDRFGITDEDREKMGRYLSKSYLDRSPLDLKPDEEEE